MSGLYAVWSYKKQLDLQCGIKHKRMNPRLHTLHLGNNSTSCFFRSPLFSVTNGQRMAPSFHILQQEILYRSWTILLISLKIYLEGRRTGPFSILLAFPFCLPKQTALQAFHFRRVGWFVSNLAGCIVSPTRQPEMLNTVRARRQYQAMSIQLRRKSAPYVMK